MSCDLLNEGSVGMNDDVKAILVALALRWRRTKNRFRETERRSVPHDQYQWALCQYIESQHAYLLAKGIYRRRAGQREGMATQWPPSESIQA